jgi:hypothetical protein
MIDFAKIQTKQLILIVSIDKKSTGYGRREKIRLYKTNGKGGKMYTTRRRGNGGGMS